MRGLDGNVSDGVILTFYKSW